jgi:two-component system response regulator DctR
MGVDFYRVLLIEDDPMVQEVNRQFIQRVEGFKVIGAAANGIEGLQQVRELKPDLIILDIYMPGQDGLKTLYHIRQEDHPLDVIVVTAAEDMETIDRALRHGAIDYIVKPFKFDRFKQALENYRLLRHLRTRGTATQNDIDQLFSTKEPGSFVDDLPKGLNAITLRQVMDYLNEQKEPRSAEEVGDVVGIARVTAWRYLDYLEKAGKVSIDLHYGGVGRPVNRYTIDRNEQKEQK